MKNCLLSFAVVLALLVGAPAYSQYMYMDVDGDGVNSQATGTGDDALDAADTGADIWLDLSKNRDGSPLSCVTDPGITLNLIAYELTVDQTGTGSVTFTGWTNNLAGYTTPLVLNDGTPGSPGFDTAAGEAWVYLTATDPVNFQEPALLKLGRLAFSVTGTPKLDFVPNGQAQINQNAATSFASTCLNNDFLNNWYLGTDWADADGTASPTDVIEGTWGKIKSLYK